MAISELYKRVLWGSMEVLGVTRSVERKIITAALIQFLIPTIFIIGELLGIFNEFKFIALAGAFILMFIALFNTLLIAKRDFSEPLNKLTNTARKISNGEIVNPPKVDQEDEINELQEAFKDMTDYLSTTVNQAEAISNEEFDSNILEKEIPGRFGKALKDMQKKIQERINELEESKKDLQKQERELQIILEEIPTPTLVINPDKSIRFYNPAMEELTGVSKEEAHDMELYEIFRTDETHDSKKTAMDIVIDKETSIEGEEGPMLTHYDETKQVRIDSAPIYDDDGKIIGGMTNLHDMTDLHELRQQVAKEAENLEEIATTISETVSNINKKAVEQEDQVDQINNDLQDFSAQMEEIASSAEEVTVSAESAEDAAEKGREASENAQDATEEIVTAIEELENSIETLVDQVVEIEDVVGVIQQLSEETDLLALNASIEAARIDGNSNGNGEVEGFGVVADEVKSLAEESQKQVDQIRDQIENIRSQAKRTEESARQTNDRVGDASEQIQEALSSFEEVADATEEAAEGIAEISQANDQQAQAVEQVVQMSENIAENAQKVRQNTDTATEHIQNLIRILDDLKENVNKLTND